MPIRLSSIVVLLLISSGCFAQRFQQGEVTFVTTDMVYVHFESTEDIALGDTLQLARDGKDLPCMVVRSKSSTSCACILFKKCKVEKKDKVTLGSAKAARAMRGARADTIPAVVINVRRHALRHPRRRFGVRTRSHPDHPVEEPADSTVIEAPQYKERIKGRVSAASYSTMNSVRGDDHRLMYRASVTASHIADSKFSAETYLNYRQLYPSDLGAYPQRTKYFNVFNLAVRYDPDSTLSVTLGRKVNNNASSLGAIDGLQVEKHVGKLFVGTITGFRPDIATYGFNPDLLEYGGYVGAQVNNGRVNSRTTLGLLQQNNAGVVDRRYVYFQHTSTFNRNLNVFSSCEVDLYNNVSGDARLTNLYVSSRYRIGRKVDVFASYDSRKRVIYYETYRNDVEMLLDDDEARQGARVRVNLKPVKGVTMGVTLSRRFQISGQNPSDNVNGYLSFNGPARLWGRWSLQVNRNTSTYLRSDVISIRHSRTLIDRKLNGSVYYRMANYTYAARGVGEGVPARMEQNYYGADLSLNLGPKLVFTVLGEASTIGAERNYRVNMSIIKRFDSKK